jgi:hypothetical protein
MRENQDEIDEKQLLLSLAKLIKDKDLSNSNHEEKREYSEDHISQLKVVSNNFKKNEPFQVGQLVQWKKNLKNRKLPHENQPAIVVEVLAEPIVTDEHNSGSPYFREPLDIVLGLLDDENTFLTFYYDSRRFEAY